MTMLAILVPFLVPQEGGILDLISGKSFDVTTTARNVAVAIVVCFVLYKAIETKLAIARILIVLLAGGLVLWGMENVSMVQGKVDKELESGPQPTLVIGQSHDPSADVASPSSTTRPLTIR